MHSVQVKTGSASTRYLIFAELLCGCLQSGLAARLVPLFGRCVVQKIQPAKVSKGGIYIPSSASQQSGCQMAKVLAVSTPKSTASGSASSEDWSKLKVGQTVMVPEFGGMKVVMGEEELLVFRGEDIIAVVDE